jgi:hypothetical protein
MRPCLVTASLLLAAACSGSAEQGAVRGERERDSVLGQSRLPGAQGVQGALDASDSAAARSARMDSIAGQQ